LNDLLRSHTEFSDHSPSARTYVLAMNKASYDRLPRELKGVIDSNSGQAAAAMAGAMWDQQAAAVANMVVERGDLIVTLLPEAVARWCKATEPVIDTWRKEIKEQKIDGAKLIAAANALLAKYANEPQPQSSQASPPTQQQVVAQPQPQANAAAKPASPPASAGPSARQPLRSAVRPAPAAPQPPQPPAQAVTAAPAPMSSVPPSHAAPPTAAPPPAAAPPAAANVSTTPAASVAKPLTAPAPTVSAPAAARPSLPPAPTAQPSVAVAPSPPASPMPKPVPEALDIPL
jgi:hypothetical protein